MLSSSKPKRVSIFNILPGVEAISQPNKDISNDFQSSKPCFNVKDNLVLGRVIAFHLFGTKKNLKTSDYISPEQEKNKTIKELSAEILPALDGSFEAKYDEEEFIRQYKIAPKWYQDLFKKEFETLMKKNDAKNL